MTTLSEMETHVGTTDVLYDMYRDNRIDTEHNDG